MNLILMTFNTVTLDIKGIPCYKCSNFSVPMYNGRYGRYSGILLKT